MAAPSRSSGPRPFRDSTDPLLLWLDAERTEAMATLQRAAVGSGGGVLLLIGEVVQRASRLNADVVDAPLVAAAARELGGPVQDMSAAASRSTIARSRPGRVRPTVTGARSWSSLVPFAIGVAIILGAVVTLGVAMTNRAPRAEHASAVDPAMSPPVAARAVEEPEPANTAPRLGAAEPTASLAGSASAPAPDGTPAVPPKPEVAPEATAPRSAASRTSAPGTASHRESEARTEVTPATLSPA